MKNPVVVGHYYTSQGIHEHGWGHRKVYRLVEVTLSPDPKTIRWGGEPAPGIEYVVLHDMIRGVRYAYSIDTIRHRGRFGYAGAKCPPFKSKKQPAHEDEVIK